MRRLGFRLALGAFVLGSVATAATAATPLEREVLAALNMARTDPAGYIRALEQYRTYFRANLVALPGQPEDYETEEGVAAVDDSIAFLKRQTPLPPISESDMLADSAAEHVADQAATGETGHEGSDGSSPAQRVRRRGGGGYVAEVIAYGPLDALDTIRQLIVDDGVADRGHRSVLYSPELRFAGVSCGQHPDYRTMCVIDLGITPDGRDGRVGRIRQATRTARAPRQFAWNDR